jgi:hypothetical protein
VFCERKHGIEYRLLRAVLTASSQLAPLGFQVGEVLPANVREGARLSDPVGVWALVHGGERWQLRPV